MKKELERVEGLYNKLKKDFKEQRVNYDIIVDEVSSIQKQNSKYRTLILDNEKILNECSKEILDLQKHVELKNKSINKKDDEVMVYKKQIDKLVEELREKSDSESFEDEKENVLNVEKALEVDRMKVRIENMKAEMKITEEQTVNNIHRLESSLKFSRKANQNLKMDYDSL